MIQFSSKSAGDLESHIYSSSQSWHLLQSQFAMSIYNVNLQCGSNLKVYGRTITCPKVVVEAVKHRCLLSFSVVDGILCDSPTGDNVAHPEAMQAVSYQNT